MEAAPKKMSRQKARLARRDAAEAQMRAEAAQEVLDDNNQDAAEEAAALKKACDEMHVAVFEVGPDALPDYARWELVRGSLTQPVLVDCRPAECAVPCA